MIISKTNDYIKHIKSLSEKKYRDEYHEFIIEGIKLVNEAIIEKANIKKIIICEELLKEKVESENVEYVSETVFRHISETQNPQGILAVVEQKTSEKEYGKTIFALDNLRDPGNLGTIIRTLDSAGISSLILSKGSADLYNPKVIRSTMGAIFRIKIIECEDLTKTLKEIRKHKFKLVVTSLQTDKSLYDINFDKKVIVIGNEANGVSKDIQDLSDEKIKIPMIGKTESLNASVATGVVLYEYVRQKLSK